MKNLLLLFFLACVFSASAQSDFYKTDKIQDIQLTFEEDNWAYLLDSLRTNGNGLLLGNVTINGTEYKNVGVRYRGSKSFRAGGKRNALYIKLNYINKKQNIDGHTSIKLSNSMRDPSLVREVLSYEIARDYMPAPQANYASVGVNKANYGMFVNVQAVDKAFLENYYGTSEGAFFKVNTDADIDEPAGCKQNIFGSLEYDESVKCYLNNFEMLSENGWDDLIELSRTLAEKPTDIGNILNVDNTLWMLAFNNILVNLDSYSGKKSVNFYLYQDKNGLFSPVVWDMNLSFGSLKSIGGGSDLTLKELQQLDPLLHAGNELKPLISQLLKNEMYKKIYLGHLRTIMVDWLKTEKYSKRADEMRRLIQVPLSNDQNKQYTFSEFQNAMKATTGKRSRIPGITELMSARYSFLKKHKSLAVLPAEISDVKVLGREQFKKGNVDVFRVNANVAKYPKRVWVRYRHNKNQAFTSVQMYDDGKHNDGKAGDGIFGAEIAPKNMESNLYYYILAENASIMSYSPNNYMFEQYSASLEELNK
jgi:hypothetical protein